MLSMPTFFASATNFASSSSLPVTNGTFMMERSSLRAVPLNSALWSRKSYRSCAFSTLRSFMASRPPCAFSHWNTLPHM